MTVPAAIAYSEFKFAGVPTGQRDGVTSKMVFAGIGNPSVTAFVLWVTLELVPIENSVPETSFTPRWIGTDVAPDNAAALVVTETQPVFGAGDSGIVGTS